MANGLTLERTVPAQGQPEAIISDGDGLFVSTIGSSGSSGVKSSLQRLLWDGTVDTSFVNHTPLNTPLGLCLIGDLIAVLDIHRVVLINRKTGQPAAPEISKKFLPTTFLNDVTVIGEHQLVVSATDPSTTDIKKLFLVDLQSREFKDLTFDFDLKHANGLRFDPVSGFLYMTSNAVHNIGGDGNGMVTKARLDVAGLHVRDAKSTSLGTFVDGIDLAAKTLLVSDWVSFDGPDGVLYRLDAEDLTRRPDKVPLGIKGFADVAMNDDASRLAAAGLTGEEIRFYRVT